MEENTIGISKCERLTEMQMKVEHIDELENDVK